MIVLNQNGRMKMATMIIAPHYNWQRLSASGNTV
jgi:hypothetical protein